MSSRGKLPPIDFAGGPTHGRAIEPGKITYLNDARVRPGTERIAEAPGEVVACTMFQGWLIVACKDSGPFSWRDGRWHKIEFVPIESA